MNKLTKRLLCLTVAMAMVILTAVTAFAVDITIGSDNSDGSTFHAYRLLNLTTGTSGGTVKYAYTVNEKYRAALVGAINEVDADAEKNDYSDGEIIAFIAEMDGKAEKLRSFADAVYGKIVSSSIKADATTTNKAFTGVAQGYYLIAESAVDGDKPTDAHTLVILDTAGSENITVDTKESIPGVEKKVYEESTDAYQDHADYDIGDDVPFRLTGTVPSHIGNYKTYYYAFHDKMQDTLSFNADSVKVYLNKVSDSNLIDSSLYTVVTEGLEADCTFEVRFKDLKKVAGVNADSKIIVDFTAKLLPGAIIGNPGNLNTVHLEYNNNPYDSYTPAEGTTPEDKGETGETKEDTVVVFTFKMAVVKVDGKENTVNLSGAQFVLYRESDSMYVKLTDGKVSGWTTEESEAAKLESAVDGTFSVTGLDHGTYYLKEIVAPDGYNLLTDAIKVTITPTIAANAANGGVIEKLTAKVDMNTGDSNIVDVTATDTGLSTISFNVANNSGILLPSTGGMGTTIFYVAGGVLVLLALVLLISRRRMKNEG